MHALLPQEPIHQAPPPGLFARFDRLVPRNLALPPLGAFSQRLSADGLGDMLAWRGRSDGPGRALALHMLVRLPCEQCVDTDRSLGAVLRELDAMSRRLEEPQDIARVTFQTCEGMGGGDRRPGVVLDAIRAKFCAPDTEVCVEAPRVDLPTLRDWRAAGVSRVLLTGTRPDPISVGRAGELAAVSIGLDCGRRGFDANGLWAAVRALARAGVARIDLGTHDCVAPADAAACRDASRPMSPRARRGALRAVAVEALACSGFRHLTAGLFVRGDDPLADARHRGRLHLEVDGLAAAPAAGTLAVGPGAFGRLGTTFHRNAAGAVAHADAVDRGGLSVAVSAVSSPRARVARTAVASLVCHGCVDFEAIALSQLVDPRVELADALRDLEPMAASGLVFVDDEGVELTPQGRHLVEVVAAAFEPRVA